MTGFYPLLFVLGLCFGSFASVIIYRIREGKPGILLGRSKCPHCNHVLGFWDLIPLISGLLLGYRCRYCKKPISKRYVSLELLMAGFFMLTGYLSQGKPMEILAFYLFVTFIFVAVSVYDILFQEIPDQLMIPAIILSLLMTAAYGLLPGKSLMMGFFVPVLFFLFLFLISQGQWLGGGDVRIGALMGILLGWPHVLIALFIAYMSGSIYSLFGILAKKMTRKSHIPFGPFLMGGAYVALFFGSEILTWYWSLI